MRRFLRRVMPRPETVRDSPALRWVAPLLERPGVWRFNRRTVAAGAAIGVLFGLATPVAQIPLAAVMAVALRANLPAAVLGTFVSNPLTALPILLLAYHVGAGAMGLSAGADAGAELASRMGQGPLSLEFWAEHFDDLAAPVILGLLLMALGGSFVTYVGVRVAWHVALRFSGRRGVDPAGNAPASGRRK